jgi:hypothetical protein
MKRGHSLDNPSKFEQDFLNNQYAFRNNPARICHLD